MKAFYLAVDGVTKELSNTVLNEISSVSPQGATVIVQVKIQAARKRIFDKIQNWIATKGQSDVMFCYMGDGPLKQMVSEMPRVAFAVLKEMLGPDAKKDLYTWWPASTYKAEWCITLGEHDG
eukprot:7186588-Pyramimonas_sp.AAC.1